MFRLTGNSILGPNSITGSRIFDGFNAQAGTLLKNDNLLVVRLLHSDKNYPLNVENDSDKNLFANNELISG